VIVASGRQTIRVAAGQCSARPMNEARLTLASLEQAIASAAERRADLLVLPECAYPAYLLGSVASYRGVDHLSTQAFVGWLQERAARYRLHIVCGFVEDTSEALYNAAVLIDDQGRELGRARKRFLWNAARDWFTPGDEIRAFDSTLGRIGVIICAETRVPEILATLIADGAELIAMPTCWVNMARAPGKYENPQVSFLIEARAREFGVPFVCANKWGSESADVGYVGQSRIVQADGSLAAEAGPSGEAVITAEIVRQRPPQLGFTDVQRARLLSSRPPVRPSATGPRVTLAVVPAAIVNERFTASKSETLLEPLARRGVYLLLAHAGHEDPAKRLAVLARAFDIHAIGLGPEPRVSSLGPARIWSVAGRAVRSFAAFCSLAGAHSRRRPDPDVLRRARGYGDPAQPGCGESRFRCWRQRPIGYHYWSGQFCPGAIVR